MNRGLAISGGILFPLACFAAVLTIGVPETLDLEAHGGAVPVMAAVALASLSLLLMAAFSSSTRKARTLACALTLVLFAVPLAAVWQSGRSSGSHIGGLLPLQDARVYHHCARLLAEGELLHASPMVSFCSRRPMFVGAFAGILTLTRQDLRWALAVMVLLTALSSYVATLEVRRSLGAAGATIFLLIVAFFHRRYAGTVLTEHLGLALGVLGFASLWRSARTGSFGTALAGLFLLTLALTARAGAFLTLPAIIVWMAWRFRHARSPWGTLGLGGLVVVLGFGLNVALVRAIGVPSGLFSNFSLTLYGLVFGGNWTLALTDHPHLAALPEIEQSRAVFRLALDGVLQQPSRLFAGAARAWGEFLGTSYPFVFVHRGLINLGLRLLTAVGLFVCVLRRPRPIPSLLLVSVLGLVASVPFIPPWDADLMRVYAATIPILAAVPALGAVSILRRLGADRLTRPASDESGAPVALYGLGVALLALTFLSPVALMAAPELPRFPARDSACPETLYVRPPRGSMVTVVPDAAAGRYPGVLTLHDYRRGFRQIAPAYPELAQALTAPPAPFALFDALGLGPPSFALVVAPAPILPTSDRPGTFWRICGEFARDPRLYDLFHARSIEILAP
jgi:hypothetical protein